jgi:hypothetical protein
MRAWLTGVFSAVAIAAGCSGPPAPDVAICRDVIHRLCLPARCVGVTVILEVNDTCEADLLARTRCYQDDFTFPEPPGRDRVVDCRRPLLREGVEPEQHPSCLDVDDMLELCPDVVAFLKETP